ncbi:DUF2007 domain-containing protein [Symbiobacterium thermophilum]|uniref:DUF2007 domain-containing protein n=1 Tax=Symbiobacterium thermophilum (strain DSM 24528 / JCM 14929 / IAM 14863 / T) TaxID=292459 RepID=Q67QK2_SYMTH|nr:DUF2007 domain-containing protein [Symbiobacterium thermophilum]BAD40041.1 hypothetical protein STH1056 [Symbiobacterium thermophilum IAM 14863]
MNYEWVEVYKAPDHVEAELVRGLLEASGIPVVTEARGAQSLPFLLGPARVGGHISIRVPPEHAQAAREVLAAREEPSWPSGPGGGNGEDEM